ncbi:tyrosine recombinase XerC [Thalassobacillus sp. CUG 92003]|uniref:tyrosine recombinase XerC n=1 Tax=Thalassobacillus sp. CUG 92003 TaxID=2736641 RepID=UPI0015E7A820|nr:tyrosine recombinase XerC [Thalassobacillus sp. CUG 92003]
MQNLQDAAQLFKEYLQIEKNASPLTVQSYEDDVNAFFIFLRSEDIHSLRDIDDALIRVWLTKLYEHGLLRRSVSRKLSCLRSFFRFLEREELVKQNPFLTVSLPKEMAHIPDFFYEEELQQLFSVNTSSDPLDQRNQAILEILYGTGIRVSECTGLSMKDIDFSIGTLLVHGKGRKERYVPFGHFAEEALETYIEQGRKQLIEKTEEAPVAVFLNARGKPISARGIRLILNKMVKKAALTVDIHPHKLRHSFATHMLNQGADLRSVQELLGHEHLSSTQIYTHVTKDHLRNIYMNSHPRAKK